MIEIFILVWSIILLIYTIFNSIVGFILTKRLKLINRFIDSDEAAQLIIDCALFDKA